MRRIVQFQFVPGQVANGVYERLYALTEDGVLWCRGEAGTWAAVDPPGDGEPFKPEMTDERVFERLKNGLGFPEK